MQPPKGGRATTTEGRKSNHCHQKKDGQFHNEKEGHQREEAQPPPPKVACVPSVRNPCAHSLEVVSSHPLPQKKSIGSNKCSPLRCGGSFPLLGVSGWRFALAPLGGGLHTFTSPFSCGVLSLFPWGGGFQEMPSVILSRREFLGTCLEIREIREGWKSPTASHLLW